MNSSSHSHQLKFLLVEFSEEETVEVVPSGWVTGDIHSGNDCQCHWPDIGGPGLSKLCKNLKSTPQVNWKIFQCKILKSFGKLFNVMIFEHIIL